MEDFFINQQFLCRLLNICANHAVIEGAEKTLEVISSVSELTRYMFDDRKVAVTLKEEYEVAENYMELQNMKDRNGRMFYIHLNSDHEEASIKHLSLLKPLIHDMEETVEVHGSEMRVDYFIEDGEDMIILVKAVGDHGNETIAQVALW